TTKKCVPGARPRAPAASTSPGAPKYSRRTCQPSVATQTTTMATALSLRRDTEAASSEGRQVVDGLGHVVHRDRTLECRALVLAVHDDVHGAWMVGVAHVLDDHGQHRLRGLLRIEIAGTCSERRQGNTVDTPFGEPAQAVL